jgi:hypothetical protein
MPGLRGAGSHSLTDRSRAGPRLRSAVVDYADGWGPIQDRNEILAELPTVRTVRTVSPARKIRHHNSQFTA